MNTGYIYAIGAAVIWGLVYALDQKILSSVPPLTLLFINSVITVVVLSPIVFFGYGPIRDIVFSKHTNWPLILICVVLASVANLFIFSGISSLNASIASIIEIAYPFFVVLFSYILFQYAPNIYFFAGGFLIFIGSVIIIRFA